MKNRLLYIILTALLAFSALSAGAAQTEIPGVRTPGLIPKPVSQVFCEGVFLLGSGTEVESTGDIEFGLKRYLETYLQQSFPDSWRYTMPKTHNVIRLIASPKAMFPAEGYKLEVSPEVVTIEAASRAGLFYGITTLLQMLPAQIYNGEAIPEPNYIQCQTITDHPQLEYRGMMLDVSRAFSDKGTVLRFIDRMAHHKLNRFHWHLTDDEGWRIELKSYPELATVGGFRGGDSPVQPIYGEWNRKYGGYFTQDEIREVVAYAAFRNIEVIPEIELPGHSRTAAKVFPSILCSVHTNTPTSKNDRHNVWCAAKEANYEMLDKILAEVTALFPSKYFHIGGDEVMLGQWKGCADCKKLMHKQGYTQAIELEDYFVKRLSGILEKYGKTPVVWDEAAARGNLNKDKSLVTGWQGVKQCLQTTKDGYKTVVMPGAYFYFDMRQSPDEDGMTWATIVDTKRVYSFSFATLGFDAQRMKNVAGVEASFFAELLLSHSPEYLDYQTYPRICALAEVAWCDETTRVWDDFYARLTGNHLARLGAMGVAYRQFPPTVDYHSGTITATAPFAEAEIRYTDDGGEPNANSKQYTTPIKDNDLRRYRFKTFYGGVGSPDMTPTAKAHFTIDANAVETFEMPLSEIMDSSGLWTFRIRVSDSGMKVNKVSVKSGDKTSTIVGYVHNVNQMHRMRIYANEDHKQGVLTVNMRNLNTYPCEVTFILERSPYIEPKVKFSSSLNDNSRFPFKHLEDYNYSTYSRTSATCRSGDHFTFTFAEPIEAYSIEAASGLTYMPRYHIVKGRVQISADGEIFTDAGNLEAGRAVIYPKGSVKAVRIVSDMNGNSENAVALQDLKITPIRK